MKRIIFYKFPTFIHVIIDEKSCRGNRIPGLGSIARLRLGKEINVRLLDILTNSLSIDEFPAIKKLIISKWTHKD